MFQDEVAKLVLVKNEYMHRANRADSHAWSLTEQNHTTNVKILRDMKDGILKTLLQHDIDLLMDTSLT